MSSLPRAGEAEALNTAFDFVVVGGTHAWGNGRHALFSTSDVEYDAAAGAVAELDAARGDMLFLENPGHNGSPHYAAVTGKDPAQLRALAAQHREERTRNAFHYAAHLAAAEGVPVFNADISEPIVQAYLTRTGEQSLTQAHASSNSSHIMRLRNETAAHTVKDRTREQLQASSDSDGPAAPHKRTAMVLYGENHVTDRPDYPSIPTILGSFGLESTVRILENSQKEREEALKMPPPPDITNMAPEEAAQAVAQYMATAIAKIAML